MRLQASRLQNYKKIRDTGWIECENLMVFVGKNEAGKSALFRGLSKLKPTDGEKYNSLKEFPHSRYTDEFKKQDWPVASGRFVLAADEKKQLGEICQPLDRTKTVTVTRYYSDKVTVDFEPAPKLPAVSNADWKIYLEQSLTTIEESVAPDGQGENWGPRKQKLMSFFQSQIQAAQSTKASPTLQQTQPVRQQIVGQMSEQWLKDILQPLLVDLDPMLEKLKSEASIQEAQNWVVENMPYFLYFGQYEVLESAIYLPELVSRVNKSDRSPRTRVQQALFKHVGVDITELARLGHHQHGQGENPEVRQQIEELSIKANSASVAMTKKFSDWWEQRRHKFTYKFNGDYFQVWVADDLDPTDVELEERSRGMQYFFSFYLLFLVEAEELYRNCILLLDEPGLHLHPTAQEKLIKFLEKLSQKNQLFYSTHSPFMIDGSHLERARAVYEKPNGTEVSADVWPRDRDTLFPLQAALGYSVCQTLFVAKKQVLVEGLTDYMLLSALNERLKADGRTCLINGAVMLPMGGTTNLAPLASMLAGHDIELAFLLDNDQAADSALKKLRKVIADVDSRCIQTSDILDGSAAEELEQLIPEDYYLDAVSRAYPNIVLAFNNDEKSSGNIADRLKAFFERNGLGSFEKWRPIQRIVQDINAGDGKVPKELFNTAEKLFEKLNALLGADK